MGTKWRRLNERVKQKLILNGKFVATSNRRCEMMFEEAHQFAEQLKKLEENLRRLQETIEEMLTDTRNIMLCALPCTYDFTPSGQAVPEEADPQLIGKNVQLDRFSTASQVLRQRLEEEVMEPLRSWLQGFQNAADQMKRLEDIRLELDSRRRTVDALNLRVEKQQNQLDMLNSSRHQIAHETAVKYLQHKEKKKNNTMIQFQEQESTMHQNLFTLIKDTSCFKEYTGLAYGILQDAFSVAHGAFPLHKNDTRLLSYGDGISSSSRVSPSTPGPLSVRTLAQTHTLPMPKEFRQSLATRSGKTFSNNCIEVISEPSDIYGKDDTKSIISEKYTDYNRYYNDRRSEVDNVSIGRYGWH